MSELLIDCREEILRGLQCNLLFGCWPPTLIALSFNSWANAQFQVFHSLSINLHSSQSLTFSLEHNITPAAPPTEPHPHPESPTHSLPDSFVNYRSKAQQHGPLGGHNRPQKPSPGGGVQPYGAIGGHTGHELGSVRPSKGEVWDRSDLPRRFGRMSWSEEEIEAIELGGANVKPGSGGA